jgi:hypothetical protein
MRLHSVPFFSNQVRYDFGVEQVLAATERPMKCGDGKRFRDIGCSEF